MMRKAHNILNLLKISAICASILALISCESGFKIMSHFPADGDKDVAQNVQIYLVFSKEIDETTIYNDTILVQEITEEGASEDTTKSTTTASIEGGTATASTSSGSSSASKETKENEEKTEEEKKKELEVPKEKLGAALKGNVHVVKLNDETETETKNALLFLSSKPWPGGRNLKVTINSDKIRSEEDSVSKKQLKLAGKKWFKFTTSKQPVSQGAPQISDESDLPEINGSWGPYEPLKLVFTGFVLPEKLKISLEREYKKSDTSNDDDRNPWQSVTTKIVMIDTLKMQEKDEESERFRKIWFKPKNDFEVGKDYRLLVEYGEEQVISSLRFKIKESNEGKGLTFPAGFLETEKTKRIILDPSPFGSSTASASLDYEDYEIE